MRSRHYAALGTYMQRFLLYSALTASKLKIVPDVVTLLVFIVPETLERVKALVTTILPKLIVEALLLSNFITLVFGTPMLDVATTPTGSALIFTVADTVPIDIVEETPVTFFSITLLTLPIDKIKLSNDNITKLLTIVDIEPIEPVADIPAILIVCNAVTDDTEVEPTTPTGSALIFTVVDTVPIDTVEEMPLTDKLFTVVLLREPKEVVPTIPVRILIWLVLKVPAALTPVTPVSAFVCSVTIEPTADVLATPVADTELAVSKVVCAKGVVAKGEKAGI